MVYRHAIKGAKEMGKLATLLNTELLPEVKKSYIAYRRCYSDKSLSELEQEFESKSTEQIMSFIFEHKLHESALEHIVFCFSIDEFSRISSQQETRHRIQSVSQQSQRYCLTKDRIEIIVPPKIEKHEDLSDWYNRINDEVFRFYNACLERGIPKEDARYAFMNGTKTRLIVSFNLRSLMNFMNERLCFKAQWEVRNLANDMKNEVISSFKELGAFLVPKCRKLRYCPESKCCGYYNEIMAVKDLFSMERYVRFIHDMNKLVPQTSYIEKLCSASYGCGELPSYNRLYYFSQYGSFDVEDIMLIYAKLSGLIPFETLETNAYCDKSKLITVKDITFMPNDFLYQPNYIKLKKAMDLYNV